MDARVFWRICEDGVYVHMGIRRSMLPTWSFVLTDELFINVIDPPSEFPHIQNVSIFHLNFVMFSRDAPKWKFLAEAEDEQNETLGRRPNTEHVFFAFFPP